MGGSETNMWNGNGSGRGQGIFTSTLRGSPDHLGLLTGPLAHWLIGSLAHWLISWWGYAVGSGGDDWLGFET